MPNKKTYRIDKEGAIDILVDMFGLDKKVVTGLGTGEHLNAKLVEVSNGKMCLKGTKVKNIDKASPEVREAFLDLKGQIEKLPNFKHEGITYRMSAYCHTKTEKEGKKDK